MAGWNYRIVRTHGEFHSMPWVPWKYLAIHEVYYDEDGKPDSCTKDAVTVGCDEGPETIKEILTDMLKAVDKPILEMSYFEELAENR